MSIMWKYLDKKAATVSAVEDYDNMVFIIDNTDERIKEEKERMVGIGSPNLDGMPKAHNPQAGEEKIVESIEKIDLMKERYRQAIEYMDWFKPAWEKLGEDERFVLEAFYQGNEYGAEAARLVCDHFGIEKNSAYKKKNRAVEHLELLLYGKE